MERSRSIDILDFIDLAEIDPVYYDTTYYLSPRETGERAYLLLKEALEKKSKVAVCKIIIRNKENLSTKFDPEKYKDNYRKALLELIISKVEGKEFKIPVREKEDKVVNLMDALKESIDMVEKEGIKNEVY